MLRGRVSFGAPKVCVPERRARPMGAARGGLRDRGGDELSRAHPGSDRGHHQRTLPSRAEDGVHGRQPRRDGERRSDDRGERSVGDGFVGSLAVVPGSANDAALSIKLVSV